jgi:hypothetical protein
MDFNLKSYRVLKVKNYLKNCDFFFFFHSAKLTSNEWISIEQDLKKLKLKYYKVFNGTTLETINNSVYKNFNQIICGIVLFIEPRFKLTTLELDLIKRHLKPLFALLSVKLNNRIYAVEQLKGFKTFSYKQNMFNFYRSLEKGLKSTYVLTDNKSSSK